MTERIFRIVLGIGLLVILYLSAVYERNDILYAYIALMLFEGITNWRVPKLSCKLRNKILYQPETPVACLADDNLQPSSISFEAERILRLVIALLLILPLIWDTRLIWVLPWFIACMLLLAGVTNICPLVMLFRWMGFK